MTAQEIQQEALSRAVGGITASNYPAIYHGFGAKGIPETEIRPRENVFTFHAWKALGRHIKHGEHGVRVATVRTVTKKVTDKETGEEKTESFSMPWSATVFHISQTEANNGQN
jgi:hypothetical protein